MQERNTNAPLVDEEDYAKDGAFSPRLCACFWYYQIITFLWVIVGKVAFNLLACNLILLQVSCKFFSETVDFQHFSYLLVTCTMLQVAFKSFGEGITEPITS